MGEVQQCGYGSSEKPAESFLSNAGGGFSRKVAYANTQFIVQSSKKFLKQPHLRGATADNDTIPRELSKLPRSLGHTLLDRTKIRGEETTEHAQSGRSYNGSLNHHLWSDIERRF